MQRLLLFLSIVLLMVSCASKRYARKAEEFEKAGLYQDAAEFYYKSASKNEKNVDAKLGLRKNGQKVLEEKLAAFQSAHKNSNHEEAVHAFQEARDYYDKVKGVGVELSIPQRYENYYQESKKIYLEKRYAEGVNELERENYDKSLRIFREIRSIDGSYKDVEEKFTVARYQPLYEKGNDQLENGLYRSAYRTFGRVVEGAGNYKQALSLQKEALNKATVDILIPGFRAMHYRLRRKNDEAALNNKLKGSLNKLDNPFIKLIDESHVGEDIYRRGSREIDHQAASLAGVDAVFMGKILRLSSGEGDLEKSDKRGYVKEEVKKENDQGETVTDYEYYKTNYQEYKKENYATVEISYQLISTDKGEILVTDQFRIRETDKVHYAEFKGDDDQLVPGYWVYSKRDHRRDEVKDNNQDVRELQKLLDAERELKSPSELKSHLYDQAVERIVEKIDQYNPEKL